MVKEILVTLFYWLLFNFLLARYQKLQFKNFKPFVTLALFNIKFATGVLIWFVYTFYYKDIRNNDVHKFYSDAIVLRNVASESPKDFAQIITGIDSHDPRFDKYYAEMKNWQRNFDEAPFNENQTIIKLNALLMFATLRVYFAHILFMCFISLIGWVLLTNAVLKFAAPGNSLFALPVLLLPSVLFWTSGVMKEPLLVLGLGVFISGLLSLNPNKNIRAWGLMITGAFIMLLIKFFVLACLMPAVIAYLVVKQNVSAKTIRLLRKMARQPTHPVLRTPPDQSVGMKPLSLKKREGNSQFLPLVSLLSKKSIVANYVVICALLLAAAFNINRIVPHIDLEQMLVNKQTHSIKEAIYYNAGSRIDMPALDNNALSIIETVPVGIWHTLMRPYLWEGKNMMMLASAIENVVVIAFIVLCLMLSDYKNLRHLNLLLFLLTFVLAYFALIGICTPVLGNLVRYKAPLLPVFLFAFILPIKSDAVPGKFGSLLR